MRRKASPNLSHPTSEIPFNVKGNLLKLSDSFDSLLSKTPFQLSFCGCGWLKINHIGASESFAPGNTTCILRIPCPIYRSRGHHPKPPTRLCTFIDPEPRFIHGIHHRSLVCSRRPHFPHRGLQRQCLGAPTNQSVLDLLGRWPGLFQLSSVHSGSKELEGSSRVSLWKTLFECHLVPGYVECLDVFGVIIIWRSDCSPITIVTPPNKVSEFPSNDHLLNMIHASSYIPIYNEKPPLIVDGRLYIDGCFSHFGHQPVLDSQTFTLSPYLGEADISPPVNLPRYPAIYRLFPPRSRDALMQILQDGERDVKRWLDIVKRTGFDLMFSDGRKV
ncbi:hypothetical protein M427DRAFT_291259 [Gonapodya prolifera JEL478]|uniref:PNPLA domain-containing protein n=1 Tax=Gonapodya prolifera (strain JEL478) TaxID=1344416 RepID=A0A139AIF7_GONPJ|nr:hypothetical protein M427DRAFT_291259 [Gonapodya prolifera JEL478]|eukprot:KXS16489.1 hypothetical protein M427DRAFT_291259 [Gonapodya prolifera JEL478]